MAITLKEYWLNNSIQNGYFAWQTLIIQLLVGEVYTHIDWQSSLCTIHRSSDAPDCHQVNACNVLTLVPPVNTLLCYVASIGANWAPPNISPHGGGCEEAGVAPSPALSPVGAKRVHMWRHVPSLITDSAFTMLGCNQSIVIHVQSLQYIWCKHWKLPFGSG